MSPRAAWRLERLGYGPVYDFAGGKMDWLAYGLDRVGSAVLAADIVEAVATCRVDEPLGEVVRRLGAPLPRPCVAVNDEGVVLGVLDPDAGGADPAASVEDVARFGITTVRPSEDVEALAHRMEHAGVHEILVTDADGVLMGMLRREAGRDAAARRP